jgi:protease-4
MKKVIVGILAIIGAMSILAVMVFVGFAVLSAMARPVVPSRVILEIDFDRAVIEAVPEDPLAKILFEDQLTVPDVVDALDRAAGDRRVKGLVARIGAGRMGLAHIQELREAVERFRAAGKPALAFADTFGEFGPGNGGYYLATAFDEIYVQPSGDVGLTGLMYETMFLRGMLDKLDIDPELDKRYEFKNAVNSYTETRFTDAHREALEHVMRSHFDQIVSGIAESRQLTEEEVRALVDDGPFFGGAALEVGLVDGLAYRDEVYDEIRERAGERARLLYVSRYLERAGRPNTRGETIALIQGHGTIIRGNSAYSLLDGSVYMGAESISRAFRAAIDDRRVQAIVFRVDSPGGSPVASDTIWQQTLRAQEAGKPVIVSMGNYAGSGGYYVAMSADKIVAQPGTITGSIGVFAGKLVTEGFWEKLGITWDEVHTSANTTFFSTIRGFDEEQYGRLGETLDRTYEAFTTKVAEGRDLPIEEVLAVARGRIWTGQDALDRGLVDELGGLDAALRLAREEIGLEPDAPIRVKRFPAPRSPYELLFAKDPESSEGAALASLEQTLRVLQPKVRMLQRLAHQPAGLVMADPPTLE